MRQTAFKAMGTNVEAWLAAGQEERDLRAWFEVVEDCCSRFRPESELSRINDDTALETPVTMLMERVLLAAARARALTEGLVDVGVGAAVVDWGYDRTFDEVTGLVSPPDSLAWPEWSVANGRLLRSPGTRLDLGGIAKGWTCDLAVEMGLATVVSAGGDIRSAEEGTSAMIMDPWGEVAAKVHVGCGALATSSVSRRRWQVADGYANHLIDPRTMSPVNSPVLSASVVARTAVDAEAGAKAVLLHGEDGLAWADSVDWIDSAVVVWHDGSVFATTGTEVAV